MMNNARLAVGLQGLAIAERAYQQAVDYARSRVQGRAVQGSAGPVAIIGHPDVRRMLMTMKAQVEAMRGLVYEVAAGIDVADRHPDAAERARAQTRVDLLIKSEEHTSELQSLMRTSYAVFCLKKKNKNIK